MRAEKDYSAIVFTSSEKIQQIFISVSDVSAVHYITKVDEATHIKRIVAPCKTPPKMVKGIVGRLIPKCY